ncbi:MAG: PstS family phosphate ABC transporter substrate-binding protein [Phycisphaerales bacterium]|nr:PstS family phosphate ABC transporter substrate-binding protein [Phycisphaerales bacterium]
MKHKLASALVGAVVFTGLSAATADDLSNLRGNVRVDGSSTVFPITEAVAEQFSEAAPNVRVTVGVSGTGGGFKRFAAKEIDISDASRPIKTSEMALLKKNGVDFIELPVAYDGLTVVVNPKNDWVDNLTVDELKKIFLSEAPAKNWSDVREGWPARPIKIFSPGTDSGTFDYFKEVIAGKKGSIRSDMSVSEDDNVLVNGVSGETDAMGFFGCAYYMENKDKLRAIPIVNPITGKPVPATTQNIESGAYAPFSRPLFIYVNTTSARKPVVRKFIDYYLAECPKLVGEVGYVKLPASLYDRTKANFVARKTGTQFHDEDGEKVEGALATVYQ